MARGREIATRLGLGQVLRLRRKPQVTLTLVCPSLVRLTRAAKDAYAETMRWAVRCLGLGLGSVIGLGIGSVIGLGIGSGSGLKLGLGTCSPNI